MDEDHHRQPRIGRGAGRGIDFQALLWIGAKAGLRLAGDATPAAAQRQVCCIKQGHRVAGQGAAIKGVADQANRCPAQQA